MEWLTIRKGVWGWSHQCASTSTLRRWLDSRCSSTRTPLPDRRQIAATRLGLGTLSVAYTTVEDRALKRIPEDAVMACGSVRPRDMDSDWWYQEIEGIRDGVLQARTEDQLDWQQNKRVRPWEMQQLHQALEPLWPTSSRLRWREAFKGKTLSLSLSTKTVLIATDDIRDLTVGKH